MKRLALLTVFVIGALVDPAAAQTLINTPLPTPPAGVAAIYPSSISGSSIVGTLSNDDGFLYNGANYTTVSDPTPGVIATLPFAVSGSNVVGFYETYSTYNEFGFLYNGTGYTTITPPAGLSDPFLYAHGISGGTAVGYYDGLGVGYSGFVYSGSTLMTLNYPSAASTQLFGISGSNIVGVAELPNATTDIGFLYNGTTFTTLSDPLGIDTYPEAVDGVDVVGYYSTSVGDYGFFYNGTEYFTLDETWQLPRLRPASLAIISLGLIMTRQMQSTVLR